MTYEELMAEIERLEELVAQVSAHTDVYPALRAVVELHRPYAPAFVDIDLSKGGGTCFHCSVDIKENSLAIPYPCPTIQAIEKELG